MIGAALLQVIAQEANRSRYLPAYRSLTSLSEYDRTTTTLNKPAGVVAGDKMVAAISISQAPGYDPVVTPPSGWTLLVKTSHTDGNWISHTHWYWKDAGGSEPASYSWTHENGLGSALVFAVSSTPPGAPAFTSQNGTGTTATALSLTTTRANQLIVFASDAWIAPGGALSPPTGSTPTFTERLDATGEFIYLASGVLASAGATGNKSHATSNSTGEPWSALLIAF